MACELDSRYGIGSEISTYSNNLIAGGVSLLFGGEVYLVSRLAQTGLIAKRAEAVYKTISSAVAGTAAAGETAYAVLSTCFDHKAGLATHAECTSAEAVKANGPMALVLRELDESNCLMSLGTAALSGAVSLKQALRARELKFEANLQEAGLTSAYQESLGKIQSARISDSYKNELSSELKTAMRSVQPGSAPNAELLKALSEEDPDTLYAMLKQINSEPRATWKEKVQRWLKGKGLDENERSELEACLLSGNSATSQNCVPDRSPAMPAPSSPGPVSVPAKS
jgi:hypothetical protein